MAVCYATAVGPKKGKSTWGVEIPQYSLPSLPSRRCLCADTSAVFPLMSVHW
jgi:hypothetical protein